MTAEQIYLLRSKHLILYTYTDEDLNTLLKCVQDELESRQNVRNKEVKLNLAKEVEMKTGKDQRVGELNQELFVARKAYAQRISNFDENRNMPGYIPYNINTGLPYDTEESMYDPSTDPDRLKPL